MELAIPNDNPPASVAIQPFPHGSITSIPSYSAMAGLSSALVKVFEKARFRDPEDAAQDVIVELLARQARGHPTVNIVALARCIARKRISRLRKKDRAMGADAEALANVPQGGPGHEAEVDLADVCQAVQELAEHELSPACLAVIELVTEHGLTQADVGANMGISARQVRNHLRRAADLSDEAKARFLN